MSQFKHHLIACLLGFSVFFAQNLHAAPTASLIAEADTGRILSGDNIYSLRHPASLTKIMTLYMVFAALDQGRLSLNDALPVSEYASTMSPSKLGLRPGQRIRVRDAILGLVTQSANDVAVVLAEGIGGSEWRFGEMMTQQANALGMKRSVYRNASGLHDDEQVTTAFDQAILARAMLYHFPKYYGYFKTRAYKWNGVTHQNHNHLMGRYEGMDGIKTGFIRQSGFNLVASARRYGKRLIGVVFGGVTAKSRDNRMAQLLDNGFNRVVAEGGATKSYAQIPVIKNDVDAADVSDIATPVSMPVAQGVIAQGDDENNADEPTDGAAAAPSASTLIKQTQAVILKKTWTIQVGVYNSRKKGLAALTAAKSRAPSYLKKAQSAIVPAKSGRKTMYRARLTGLTEAAARSACASLGKSCTTLPPQG
ncbi:MAG: D-alanyl-D-alanine carboxypeptidase [Alphaproteobacteria bacterium]|nr:D-alanyl-D-alanine carboxypeptidase [Alphaproteobacteria bacterium]